MQLHWEGESYQLQSNESNYNHLHAESGSDHHAFHSQHSTTWWSDCKLVRKEVGLRANSKTELSAVYQVVVRTEIVCISPVDTVPYGVQIVNLWEKRWGLEPTLSQSSVQNSLFHQWYHSLLNDGQNSDRKFVRKEAGFRAQHSILYFTHRHSATWWSDCKLVRKEVWLRVRVD